MERVYYDLLRIYANRLELENSLLIVFGFSFDDVHILDITKRALKNPGLLLLICAHSLSAAANYEAKLGMFNNIVIVHPDGTSAIEFEQFNSMLESVIPKSVYVK